MERFYQYLPQQLVHFVLVTLFSLLIGLSQRRLTLRYNNDTTHFVPIVPLPLLEY